MKYVLIAIILVATSCVTQRACLEKFPPEVGSTVTYRDTVYVFRTDTDTLWAVSSWMDTVNVSSGQIIGQAWVARDSIFIKVVQKDTVYQVRDSIRTETIVKTVTVTEQCKDHPLLDKIIVIGVILLTLMIVAKILFR